MFFILDKEVNLAQLDEIDSEIERLLLLVISYYKHVKMLQQGTY